MTAKGMGIQGIGLSRTVASGLMVGYERTETHGHQDKTRSRGIPCWGRA